MGPYREASKPERKHEKRSWIDRLMRFLFRRTMERSDVLNDVMHELRIARLVSASWYNIADRVENANPKAAEQYRQIGRRFEIDAHTKVAEMLQPLGYDWDAIRHWAGEKIQDVKRR